MQSRTEIIMGMPVRVILADRQATSDDVTAVMNFFRSVDERFSPFKPNSEVSRANRKEIQPKQYSADFQTILQLAEETRVETAGYFDMYRNGLLDPSGMVKGWAIQEAADQLHLRGFQNFVVDAGGDVQVSGRPEPGRNWKIGIRNPFNTSQIVKTVELAYQGIATSGTYERGQHIYNPKTGGLASGDIVSLTVIAPNIYDADRFATAAFAMGPQGISYLSMRPDVAAYMITSGGQGIATENFSAYVSADAPLDRSANK